jgi:hypothetical protein
VLPNFRDRNARTKRGRCGASRRQTSNAKPHLGLRNFEGKPIVKDQGPSRTAWRRQLCAATAQPGARPTKAGERSNLAQQSDVVRDFDDARNYDSNSFGPRSLVVASHSTSKSDSSVIDAHLHSVARNSEIPMKRCRYGELDPLIATSLLSVFVVSFGLGMI